MKTRIRLASSSTDVDGILEVQKTCYRMGMCESFDVFESMIVHGWSYVAVDESSDEKIVGYIVAHPWHTLAYPPHLHTCLTSPPMMECLFIHDIAVLQSHQHLGIAHIMFNTLCKRLTKHTPILPCTFVAVHNSAGKHVHAIVLPCAPDILRSYGDESATYMMYKPEYIKNYTKI